ncbi:terpene synthase family protein [Streptomyces sparsus]
MDRQPHTSRRFRLHIPPARTSQDMAAARAHNLSWLTDHGLLHKSGAERYLSFQIAEGTARIYPDATGEAQSLALDTTSWIITFDDFVDDSTTDPRETAQRISEVLEILNPPPAKQTRKDHHHPLVTTFNDLWQREQKPMPEHWRTRARETWTDLLLAWGQQTAEYHAGRTFDGLDSYLALRRRTVGFTAILDLAETTSGLVLPDHLFHAPEFRHLVRTWLDVTIYANDYYSVDKESIRDIPVNAIFLLEQLHHCDRPTAYKIAGDLLQQRLDEFVALRSTVQQLGEGATDDERLALQHQISTMNHMIGVSVTWTSTSPRQTDPVTSRG